MRQIALERTRIVAVNNLCRAGRRRGFAPVEHNCAQKTQIGRRQRSPVHRDRIRLAASILITDVGHLIVRIRRHCQGNPDQPARPQQAVRGPSALEGRYINVVVAVRSVHGTEDRICALGKKKAQIDIRRRNRHAVACLVACAAGSAVGSHALEEGTGLIHSAAVGAVGLRGTIRIRKEDSVRNELSKVGKLAIYRRDCHQHCPGDNCRVNGHAPVSPD